MRLITTILQFPTNNVTRHLGACLLLGNYCVNALTHPNLLYIYRHLLVQQTNQAASLPFSLYKRCSAAAKGVRSSTLHATLP